jgi:hypothetical protein
VDVAGLAVIGHGIEQTGLAHALSFVVDNDSIQWTKASEADLDGAFGKGSAHSLVHLCVDDLPEALAKHPS